IMKILLFIRNAAITFLLLFLATRASTQIPDTMNLIPIPPLIEPVNDTIKLEMRIKRHKFDPANPSNKALNGTIFQPFGLNTYAYNQKGSSAMTVLGPTLHWERGKQINLQVTNRIDDTTTTHWHGLQLPSMWDGGPHQMILKGATWKPSFEVLDGPATMWYHPHLHDKTWQQVQAGAAGMIIIDDPADIINPDMPHTYGVDDIPLIIGDMSTSYDAIFDEWKVNLLQNKRPWNVVNGVVKPYVNVPAHLVRLRILNGSSRKAIVFGLSKTITNEEDTTNLEPFTLIATDGGYVLKPETLTMLRTGSGERSEIVLNLEGLPIGSKVYLRNLKHQLPGSVVGSPHSPPSPPNNNPSSDKGGDGTNGYAYLELRIVADPPGYVPITTFTPFVTEWPPRLQDTFNIAKRRTKELVIQYDSTIFQLPNGQDSIRYFKVRFTFDSLTYKTTRVDDTVCVDTKEIWTIDNTSRIGHPFHMHKVQFRILDIWDKKASEYLDLKLLGLNGPKDDVLVMPDWKMRLMAAFDLYPDHEIKFHHAYMYHCHILPHEDNIGGGMMRQFVVTDDHGYCPPMVDNEEQSSLPSMDLFPNPTEGSLFLRGHSTLPSTVNIFDLQGRVVRTQEIAAFEGNVAIDIEGIANGLYLLQWRTDRSAVTGKIVVQHP
ncbi:MAG: multicopper oxidase domain-containing protein, partial [Saprospiraceae bacterium]